MKKINMNKKLTVELTRREAELLSLAAASALLHNHLFPEDHVAARIADKKLMDAINGK